jgi:hypothetical protein
MRLGRINIVARQAPLRRVVAFADDVAALEQEEWHEVRRLRRTLAVEHIINVMSVAGDVDVLAVKALRELQDEHELSANRTLRHALNVEILA